MVRCAYLRWNIEEWLILRHGGHGCVEDLPLDSLEQESLRVLNSLKHSLISASEADSKGGSLYSSDTFCARYWYLLQRACESRPFKQKPLPRVGSNDLQGAT